MLLQYLAVQLFLILFQIDLYFGRNCGSSFSTNSRIIGGQESENGSWPWMVVINHILQRGYRTYKCGGSLVTAKHVITAAHCVVNSNNILLDPKQILVILGVHDLSKVYDPGALFVGVDAVQNHEHFDSHTFQNDIAVLRLKKSVPFSDNIAPICLPYNSLRYEDLAGKKSTVIGFGKTSVNSLHSNVLMEVSVDILDQQECRWIYERFFQITSVYLCAGAPDGSRYTCKGDSGGPLMILGNDNRYYLIGIVSFGIACAQNGDAGLYTRVTEFLDWLTPKLAD